MLPLWGMMSLGLFNQADSILGFSDYIQILIICVSIERQSVTFMGLRYVLACYKISKNNISRRLSSQEPQKWFQKEY